LEVEQRPNGSIVNGILHKIVRKGVTVLLDNVHYGKPSGMLLKRDLTNKVVPIPTTGTFVNPAPLSIIRR
jgi:hypothetical protein